MGWENYRRRRAAIDAVLTYATDNPEAGLPFAQAKDIFETRSALVLALHYEWTLALWAHIDLAATPQDAWNDARIANPTLARLLDDHILEAGPRLAKALDREHRLLFGAPAERTEVAA